MTPTFFGLLVILAGFARTTEALLYLQILFCLFGGAAAINLPALGGATITPAVCFVPILAVRAVMEVGPRACARQLTFSGGGLWLMFAVLVGVAGGMLLPRLLPNTIQIVTIDRETTSGSTVLMPIAPVSGNITQSAYALGNLCTFVVGRALLRSKTRLNTLCDAVLVLSALNCVAAVIGLAEFYAGLPSILEYVRNAGYTTYGNYELGGLMRIQGTFSEASMFAAFTVPLFVFNLELWMKGERRPHSGALAVSLLFLLLISTSTTAYFGLASYSVFLGCKLLHASVTRRRLPGRDVFILAAWAGVVVIIAVVAFVPSILDRVTEFLDVTILGKLESSSGRDRSSTNRAAWLNFVDTFGVGVGMGTARASSFVLVLLSNLGIIGSALFLLFLWRVTSVPAPRADESGVSAAASRAVMAAVMTACAGWSVFDLGVAFYVLAAAASVPARLSISAPHQA